MSYFFLLIYLKIYQSFLTLRVLTATHPNLGVLKNLPYRKKIYYFCQFLYKKITTIKFWSLKQKQKLVLDQPGKPKFSHYFFAWTKKRLIISHVMLTFFF